MNQTNLPPLEPKEKFKVSTAMPYLEKIALEDRLSLFKNNDMTLAWNKFKLLLIICEQNGLKYWIMRELYIAKEILKQSIVEN